VRHEGEELIKLDPVALWPELIDVHRFEKWWSWLRDAHLEPDEVVAGSVLTFAIVSPLPYKLHCRVEFVEVVPEESIQTIVSGDLKGWATLDIEPVEEGSAVLLRWELEPTQAPVRVLVRIARPLIVRTKDWAIDIALRSFRRNVERG
jgi:carbon monoxide dehydrogenase subunit G